MINKRTTVRMRVLKHLHLHSNTHTQTNKHTYSNSDETCKHPPPPRDIHAARGKRADPLMFFFCLFSSIFESIQFFAKENNSNNNNVPWYLIM